MTDTLPLTVEEVSGPILMGEHPALKWTGKVRWERPFLKQVTDDGIGVEVDILDNRALLTVEQFLVFIVSTLAILTLGFTPRNGEKAKSKLLRC